MLWCSLNSEGCGIITILQLWNLFITLVIPLCPFLGAAPTPGSWPPLVCVLCSVFSVSVFSVFSVSLPFRDILCQWNRTPFTSAVFHFVWCVHPSGTMSEQCILFYCWGKSRFKGIPSCVYLFTGWTFGWSWAFWLSRIMLLWAFMYKSLCRQMFSCFLNRYLGMELLCWVVHLCLTSEEIATLLSKMAEPSFTPTNSAWGFESSHSLPRFLLSSWW